MRNDDLLFFSVEWHRAVEGQKQGAKKRAEGLTWEQFQKSSEDDLVAQIVEAFSLVPPTVTPENIEVSQREVDLQVDGWRGPVSRKGTAIDVRLPFTGDEGMFKLRPSSFDSNPPRGRVRGAYLVFTVQGIELSADQVRADIDRWVSAVQKYLGYQHESVKGFAEELRRVTESAVAERKKKLEADKGLISGLGFKVRE